MITLKNRIIENIWCIFNPYYAYKKTLKMIETNKLEKEFPISKLSFEELKNIIPESTLMLGHPKEGKYSTEFIGSFFSHLEKDLGISKYKEVLNLWIEDKKYSAESVCSISNVYECTRIRFEGDIIAFVTGKGELFRHEMFTVYNQERYNDFIAYVKNKYIDKN